MTMNQVCFNRRENTQHIAQVSLPTDREPTPEEEAAADKAIKLAKAQIKQAHIDERAGVYYCRHNAISEGPIRRFGRTVVNNLPVFYQE